MRRAAAPRWRAGRPGRRATPARRSTSAVIADAFGTIRPRRRASVSASARGVGRLLPFPVGTLGVTRGVVRRGATAADGFHPGDVAAGGGSGASGGGSGASGGGSGASGGGSGTRADPPKPAPHAASPNPPPRALPSRVRSRLASRVRSRLPSRRRRRSSRRSSPRRSSPRRSSRSPLRAETRRSRCSLRRSEMSRRTSSFTPPGWLGVSATWPRNRRLDGWEMRPEASRSRSRSRSRSSSRWSASSSSAAMDVMGRARFAPDAASLSARFSLARRSSPNRDVRAAGTAKTCDARGAPPPSPPPEEGRSSPDIALERGANGR